MHPTETSLLPGDTFWSLGKYPRLVRAAQASVEVRPAAADSLPRLSAHRLHRPRPKGNTGPLAQPPTCTAAGPRGAAAGSETRSRVRHQPQVPREQAQEVEDDGGFVAPRRVLESAKEMSGAEAAISSREAALGPSPPEPLLHPSPPESPLPAASTATSHGPRRCLPSSRPAPLTALRVWGRLLGGRRDFLQEPGRTSSSWREDSR